MSLFSGFFDGGGTAAIGAIGSFLGGSSANADNRREARKQRAWQQNMYEQRYQMEVKDRIAAGLNPMLSATSAAGGVPSGAVASQQDEITPAINTALAARMNKAEVANKEKQNDLLEAQVDKTEAETFNTALQANQIIEETKRTSSDINRIMSEYDRNLEAAGLSRVQADTARALLPYASDMRKAEIQSVLARTGVDNKTAEKLASDIYMQSLRFQGLENIQAFDKSWFGRNVAPYLGSAREISDIGFGSFRAISDFMRTRKLPDAAERALDRSVRERNSRPVRESTRVRRGNTTTTTYER